MFGETVAEQRRPLTIYCYRAIYVFLLSSCRGEFVSYLHRPHKNKRWINTGSKKTDDQQENRTPNLQIWNLTRYQLRQPAMHKAEKSNNTYCTYNYFQGNNTKQFQLLPHYIIIQTFELSVGKMSYSGSTYSVPTRRESWSQVFYFLELKNSCFSMLLLYQQHINSATVINPFVWNKTTDVFQKRN